MSEFPETGGRPSRRVPFPAHSGSATASAAEALSPRRAAQAAQNGRPDGTLPLRRDRRARRDERRGPVSGFFSLVREVGLVLVIALGLSLLIKTLLVQAFFIPSPSMESTLIRGDRVLVSKLTPGPFDLKRGDVVVFKDPAHWLAPTTRTPEGKLRDGIRSSLTFVGLLPADSDEHLIKRTIGLPGDKVVCCTAAGKLTVNGAEITEPYLFHGDVPSDLKFSVTVPAGHIWVMGDHRSVSEDSRAHLNQPGGGMVPMKDVVGRAFIKVWPLNRAGLLRNPSAAFAAVPKP